MTGNLNEEKNEFTANKRKWLPGIIILVCLLLVIITIIYVIIYKKTGGNKKGGFPGFGMQQTQTVSIRTEEAKAGTLQDYVITNGEIEALSSVSVLPDMAGRIVSVRVSLGDKVRKGQLIAYVDPSTPGSQYANSPVYAPITGTVIQTPLASGTKVSQTSVITVIGDTSTLQVSAKVSERYVADLKIGLKADINLEAYGDEIFYATVKHVSPVLDASSRTKEIVLSFDKKDSRVNAGMFAKIKLYTNEYSGAVLLNQDAVVEKNDTNNVWILNPETKTVSLRPVTLGESVDNVVQILSGVEEGEKVVVEGMRNLSEGASVIDVADSTLGNNGDTNAALPDGLDLENLPAMN